MVTQLGEMSRIANGFRNQRHQVMAMCLMTRRITSYQEDQKGGEESRTDMNKTFCLKMYRFENIQFKYIYLYLGLVMFSLKGK